MKKKPVWFLFYSKQSKFVLQADLISTTPYHIQHIPPIVFRTMNKYWKPIVFEGVLRAASNSIKFPPPQI